MQRGLRAFLLACVLLLAGQLAGCRLQEATPPRGLQAADALPSLQAADPPGSDTLPGFLPADAARTIALIRAGGPFPYRQDGGVFGNREGLLPRRPRGWYREYTVDTPGLSHRGARRIVTGGDPPRDWYYTDDHYESFRAFQPGGSGSRHE